MISININSDKTSLYIKYSLVLCIFALYIIFYNSYRAELLDNAWMMHNIYLSVFDRMGAAETAFGYSNIRGLFGKLFEFVYVGWFDIVGWHRDNGFILSIIFSLLAVWIFYAGLRALGYSKNICIIFALVVLVFDPFVGMAHKLRSEAFILFLISTSFLFLVKKRYILSAIVAVFAVETHPAGAFVFAYSAAIFLYWYFNKEQDLFKKILLFMFGMSLGGIIFIFIHYENLIDSNNVQAISEEFSFSIGSLWHMYFWATGRQYYYRHIPEILAIVIALFVYFKHRMYITNRKINFEIIFFIMIVIAGTLLPRGNYQYMVYVFIPIILLMVVVFEKIGRLNLFVILFMLIQIPQYIYLQYLNYGYDHDLKISEYQKNVPDNQTIVGPEIVWYAFKDKDYKTYEYFFRWTRSPKIDKPYYKNYPNNFTLIIDPFFRKKLLTEFKKITDSEYNKVKIKEFHEHYKNRVIEIYSYSKIVSLKNNI